MPKRTILLTGASGGIGGAVCRQLLRENYAVIDLGRRNALPKSTPQYWFYDVDLLDFAQLQRVVKHLMNEMPAFDGAILAAGSGRFGHLEEFSAEQIRYLLELNLMSPILLCRWLVPFFKRKANTDLIFVGSEAALRGGKKGAVYSASKFGLRGFTQALRTETCSQGLRVGLINPGMVRSGFFDDLDFSPAEENSCALTTDDVATCIVQMLEMPAHCVLDEINLSPLKHSISFKKKRSGPDAQKKIIAKQE